MSKVETAEEVPHEELVDPGALSGFIAPVKKTLVLGVIMSGFSGVITLVPYIAIAEIARLFFEGEWDEVAIWSWVVAGVIAVVLRTVLYGGALSVCHYADAEFRYILRSKLTQHLGTVPLGWFLDAGSGEVKKAVSDDVKRMHTIVAHVAADITSAIVAPTAAIIYLFVMDWRFAAVVVGYVIFTIAVVAPAMQRGYQKYMDEYNRAQAGLSKAAVELVDGIEVVKTFGLGSTVFNRFSGSVQKLTDIAYLWTAAMGKPAVLMNILYFPGTMVAVIMISGFAFVETGLISPVDVLPFLLVGVGLPNSYLAVASLANQIREAKLAATHLGNLMRIQGLPESHKEQVPANNTVQFEGVTFGYAPEKPVVHDISFSAKSGTVTALVGLSGSGKTTLARLIPRFWDVHEGAISIGGVDIRDISQQQLLSRIAIVFQDTMLLADTLRENIRLAKPEASDREVIEAAKLAQIHDRIVQLPQGYDTLLGSEGAHLSGGEMQRVTIARAFLQNAPILILDEATAHADPHSEVQIQQALARLSRERTVIVIAHRLHTIMSADQIVVLDAGKLVESGTHEELIDLGGSYARLWQIQQLVKADQHGVSQPGLEAASTVTEAGQ